MMLNGQVDAEGVAKQMGMSLYQFRQHGSPVWLVRNRRTSSPNSA